MTLHAVSPVRDDYERDLRDHWDAKTADDINLLLGADDDLYHHHYGIGDYDRRVLDAPEGLREALVLRELHRLENEQTRLIVDTLGDVPAHARGMDAGSGRGGTAFVVADRFGCRVDGVNFCRHHIDFAEEIAHRRGWADRVRFHEANMLDAPFADGTFDFVYSNETTMYADLGELFAEFARLLRPGGRYVFTTWCRNDIVARRDPSTRFIDEHYVCRMHRRSTYLKALADNGLVPYAVTQHVDAAIPYWELRQHSELRTGVEEAFLAGYRNNSINYLVVGAERR